MVCCRNYQIIYYYKNNGKKYNIEIIYKTYCTLQDLLFACELAGALAKNNTLGTLYLDDNQITDTGACGLAGALAKNSTLGTLYLRDNQITDTGACELAGALAKNKTLETRILAAATAPFFGR